MNNKKILLVILLTGLFLVAGCNQNIVENEISEGNGPVKGLGTAPITMVAFEDFQCPYCQAFNLRILPQLEEEYIDTGKVKLVYRDFPVYSKHPMAQKAAEAAECARDQGKFWEYHDIIYESQKSLSIENLKKWVAELGLDSTSFDECLDSGKMASEVTNDYNKGLRYGVDRTPTTFINGIPIRGLVEYSEYKKIIDEQLKRT
jgi:protein-disulfide isomerase|tara:strand:- start:270 stop:878 length:609 start_codon:yes stop_codon:yes gene_type:complete